MNANTIKWGQPLWFTGGPIPLLSEWLLLGWVIRPHAHCRDERLVWLNERPRPEGLAPERLCPAPQILCQCFAGWSRCAFTPNGQDLEFTLPGVLVSKGCHKLDGLRQQKFILSQLRGLKVQNQSVSRVRSFWRLCRRNCSTCVLASGGLLVTLGVHSYFCFCLHMTFSPVCVRVCVCVCICFHVL